MPTDPSGPGCNGRSSPLFVSRITMSIRNAKTTAGYSARRLVPNIGSRTRMSPGSPKSSPLAAVERAFATLPERYLGARPGFEARYRVSLEDLGRQWEIHLTE